MTWDEAIAVGVTLPEVEVSTAYGTPALKVRGRLLTRLRPEDDSLVLLEVGFDERGFLIEADPQTFHTTAHYKDYPAVLARLGSVDPGTLARMLERRWRAVAPRRLVKLPLRQPLRSAAGLLRADAAIDPEARAL